MPAGSWFEDVDAPFCLHDETVGASVDLYGVDEPVPAERCLDCRAVRLLTGAPELRVAYRAEPLVVRKAEFSDAPKEKPRWRRPSFVPESWWNDGPRYA
jgi:hypothetical protein